MAGHGVSAVELNADCEACGLEGGVVEIYDALVAACRFGIPSRALCKLCGVSHEATLDREASKPMREIPANRCPVCIKELAPAAIDDRRCEQCGVVATLKEIAPAKQFATIAELEAALDAWAEHEKFPTREALVNATFAEPDITKNVAALRAKEPLEILADPFANMGVRTTGGARGRSEKKKPAAAPPPPPQAAANAPILPSVTIAATLPTDPIKKIDPPAAAVMIIEPQPAPATPIDPGPPSAPPRAIVYPLVSVIAADGEIHPEERALIDRFLQSEGLPALSEDEYCVHHPSEVAHWIPKERREDVVKLMCETAAVDGMPDESERRVIRAYATAWGVEDEQLEFWLWGYESMNTSLTRALWLKIRRFVLSARWSEEQIQRRSGTE